MVTFVALYRGASLPSAQLVAVATDPQLVAHVAGALLRERQESAVDPAVAALAAGRRRALRVVKTEAEQVPGAAG